MRDWVPKDIELNTGSYDIVFVGQMGMGEIVPFQGPPFVELGSPILFAAIAASRLKKKIAAVTTVSEREMYLLDPLRNAGVDLFVKPGGGTFQYRVVFPTPNVDERQPFLICRGGEICEIPPVESCLVHLCSMGAREVQLNLIRSLKARGFRLSVDMQGFVLQGNDKTGVVHPQDVPEKKEILNIVDFVKLDAVEAKILTGTDSLQDQADILETWGKAEIIITSSEGALSRANGKSMFAKFTNRNTVGRMGRGDTLMGSYLARRLDHPVAESLRFAIALTSIKLESSGPFRGSIEDVMQRMDEHS
jgi:sugar/nucleoside kinase (ribokinase family)